MTFGDWPLKYQLPIEAKQKEIKLGPHFQQFINLMSLINEVYGLQELTHLKIPEDLATHYKIGNVTLDYKSKSAYYCELMVEFFTTKLLPEWHSRALISTTAACYSPTDFSDQKPQTRTDLEEEKGFRGKRSRSRSKSFERRRK